MRISVAGYIGALLITYVLTRITNRLVRTKVDKRTSALLSFIIILPLVLLIASHTMDFKIAIAYYVPSLLVWLAYDLSKTYRIANPNMAEKPDLIPEELGTMEMNLDWVVVLRMFCMLGIPLFAALFFKTLWIKTVFWVVSAYLFLNFTNAWGHSVIALMLIIIPLYVFFEWDNAPQWLAYVIGFLAVFELRFINKRIKDISFLRNIDQAQEAKRDLVP